MMILRNHIYHFSFRLLTAFFAKEDNQNHPILLVN